MKLLKTKTQKQISKTVKTIMQLDATTTQIGKKVIAIRKEGNYDFISRS